MKLDYAKDLTQLELQRKVVHPTLPSNGSDEHVLLRLSVSMVHACGGDALGATEVCVLGKHLRLSIDGSVKYIINYISGDIKERTVPHANSWRLLNSEASVRERTDEILEVAIAVAIRARIINGTCAAIDPVFQVKYTRALAEYYGE